MNSASWFLLVGALLLARGVTAPALGRLPLTPAILYLAVGLAVGPSGLGLLRFNPLKESSLLEVLTEAAVLISLFSAGVKMPVPVTFARWRAPILLASVSMTVTVGLIAAFAWVVLGLPPGAAVLLGAILAPTDPVLATDVQTRHPGDRDELRATLTCEAGMNDGSAFPFVLLGLGMLGLHDLGESWGRWVLVDVVWSTVGAIAIGVVSGAALAHVGRRLRGHPPRHDLMDDFLGLGLIGMVYGASVLVGAGGFLAVFVAAVTLRQTEEALSVADPTDPARPRPDRMEPESVNARPDSNPAPTVSGGALIFKEQLERVSELTLVLLLGGTLYVESWSWRAVGLALFVFAAARPVSVLVGLVGTSVSWPIRGMVGWFGVRGIGSLYYLMYAIQHGVPEDVALDLVELTLITVALSIVVHGISVKPLMDRFVRRLEG